MAGLSRFLIIPSLMLAAAVALAGCGEGSTPAKAEGARKSEVGSQQVAVEGRRSKVEKQEPAAAPPKSKIQNPESKIDSSPSAKPASEVAPRTNLADLVQAAASDEFKLPALDDGKIAAAGIRKLPGKHLTLYTDLPPGPAADELPRVCDAAVPLLCEYFGVDPTKVAEWKIVGSVMQDKERFVGAGLFTPDLPDFPNGFSRGSQVWLFDQPSDYYRRHLLIHELVHAFMTRWLGGAGPPWYMEGMAELLGTHRWAEGKLELAHSPRTKDEVPYWGRVKIVQDEFAANRGMLLTHIMTYNAQAHLHNAPYG
jgi:hypothetical protein